MNFAEHTNRHFKVSYNMRYSARRDILFNTCYLLVEVVYKQQG